MRFVIETDDEAEHRQYLAGPRALDVMLRFAETLRQKVKYGEKPETTWEMARALFAVFADEILREADYL